MKKKLTDLLEGSAVTPKTHPVLVSLLSLAVQSAGVKKAGNGVTMRLHRDWKRVCAAFQRATAAGITDAKLRAAMPFPGLLFTDEEGWQITAAVPLTYRQLVAEALDATANTSEGALKVQDIHDVNSLRDAQTRNRLPSIEADLPAPGRLEGRMLPGRRIIVSRELYGKRVHSLLQADEFGRLSALTHERSALLCRKFHDSNPLPQ